MKVKLIFEMGFNEKNFRIGNAKEGLNYKF